MENEKGTSPAANGTVMVVDDYPANLRLLLECLIKAGYRTLIAEDGAASLEQAAYALPDIILLDVMMPGIDGFETCRRLKGAPETARIPVIMMTALTETEHKLAAFKAGAVDYITKPFQQEEVLARIDLHLTLRRQSQALERALAQVKQLSGLLPICARCKKIRNDGGYWEQIEAYITQHSDAEFSHSICPACAIALYPELFEKSDGEEA